MDVRVTKACKLGPNTCLVQLKTRDEKEKVMKNKNKLKNLDGEKIFINEDLTVSERRKQTEIRKMAENIRRDGRLVKVGYNKIVVDGEEWRWNKNKNKLEKTKN